MNHPDEITFEDGAVVPSCDFVYPGDEPETESPDRDGVLFGFLKSPGAMRYFGGSAYLKRVIALEWVLNPGAFDGKSLAQVAKDMGVTQQALSKYAAQCRRDFKLQRGRCSSAHR